MFSIAIRYLTGRAAAASTLNREEAEWPPHPGRLFMALVAAWGTSGRSSAGEAALRWLESLAPPSLTASDGSDGPVVTAFVPVNDARGEKLLPELRRKAERHFPSFLPDDDTAYFTWPAVSVPDEHRAALESICGAVTSLGNSRSLVQAWLAESPPPSSHVPSADAPTHQLRVATPGRLDHLEERFHTGQFPEPGAWHGYRAVSRSPVTTPVRPSSMGEVFVLKQVSGQRLGLQSTLLLTKAVRGAVLSLAGDDAPEFISGHAPGGGPSKRSHLAIVPLPDVGHDHADGHLLGLAVVLPSGLSSAESNLAVRTIAALVDAPIVMGKAGSWSLGSEPPHEPSRKALALRTWTQASTRWATVTPVVLDRYPHSEGDAEESIRVACERIGLPRPRDVVTMPVAPFVGVPTAREFPAEPAREGKPRRWHTHAVVSFDVPVTGPVLIGAGRYRGYGFFRPMKGTT